MYLSRLLVKNYRSIKDLDLSFKKGKNIIIGRNNAGKSNIIKALDIVLGENSPIFAKSENITQKDFYSHKKEVEGQPIEESADEIIILCELTREPGEALNYDEMYNCYGFYATVSRAISNEGLIERPASVFEIDPDTLSRAEKNYINPKLRHQKSFEQEFEDKYHFTFVFQAKKDENGKITSKELRFLYRENTDLNWFLGFKAPIRNEFLQSAIIHSFRDPQMQLRLNDWSWYGKLMRYLTQESDEQGNLEQAFEKVRAVADQIFESAKESIHRSSLDVAFPGAEIHFQFSHDKNTDIYKGCNIYIDDGVKTALSEKGSGIQSATIIGLFNYYTKEINTVTSALLCVEEPELYLHPHARRVLSGRLDDFTDAGKNQVIVTTHSSEFISAKDCGLNVLLARKDAYDGTTVSNIELGQNKSLLLDSNHKEIFFADKVIICEGIADEMLLKWISSEKFPNKIDENNISIIPVGGKNNIIKLSKLIRQLEINCYVFSDFDFLIRDDSEDADPYKTDQHSYRHKSVENLTKAFFEQDCIAGKKGKDIFIEIQKLRQGLKKEDVKSFYTAKKIEEFSNKEMLDDFLAKLRKTGVGILSAELEDFSKKQDYISSSKKITENKIFDLSSKLVNGESIEDYFDTIQVEEFLSAVIND